MEDNFAWNHFSIGFWHPFGPHGDEKPDDILLRKTQETLTNEWTLWSFKFFRKETLHQWTELIAANSTSPVYALCSDSKVQHTTLPSNPTAYAKSFRSIHSPEWWPIPSGVKVTFHPTGDGVATAFVVKRVITLSVHNRKPPFLVERYSLGQKEWRSDLSGSHEGQLRLPTRSESIIRVGGRTPMPSVQAVLELKFPYIVAVK